MKAVPIDSEAHWHELRAKHIGGSEAAALFNQSPYFTRYSLWHAKAGNAPLPEPDNERVDWGKILEPAIAEGVSREMRWQLEARSVYCIADDVEGMGCTIDYHVVDHEDGPGLVEIKNVDWLQWKQTWTETNAPPHIEIQVQHELAVTGYAWGAIAVLIGGNDLRIYERKPHPATIARLRAAVSEFWREIADKEEPDPFGTPSELDTLRALYNPPDPEIIADLTDDIEAFETARMLQWAREQERFHRVAKESAQAKLLHWIGKASRIVLPGFDIRRNKLGHLHKVEMLPGAEAPTPNPGAPFI